MEVFNYMPKIILILGKNGKFNEKNKTLLNKY